MRNIIEYGYWISRNSCGNQLPEEVKLDEWGWRGQTLSQLRFLVIALYFMIYVTSIGKTFGPLHYSRHDLAVMTLMRGRDHGVSDYNTVREALGLPKIQQWQEINPWLYSRNREVSDTISFIYLFYIIYYITLSHSSPILNQNNPINVGKFFFPFSNIPITKLSRLI